MTAVPSAAEWLSRPDRRFFRRSSYGLDREPCRATNRNGNPCNGAAMGGITLPLCNTHSGYVARLVTQEVEATARILFRRWLREVGSRGKATATPKQTPRHSSLRAAGVYFIAAEHPKWGRLIKIGCASNIESRLKQIGYHGFIRLTLLGAEFSPPGEDPRFREQELHRSFKHLRVKSEWFAPGDELLCFVESLRNGGG